MKKLIFVLMAIIAISSCSKEDHAANPDIGESNIVIKLGQSNNTRAFFDNTGTAELWERRIYQATIYAYDQTGQIILRRQLTAAEINAAKLIFPLPIATHGKTISFYAVANVALSANQTATEGDLLNHLEQNPAQYNGTMDEVIDRSHRIEGFVMSASAKALVESGRDNQITLPLKRTVAKVAVKVSLDPAIKQRHPNATIKFSNATISGAATSTTLFDRGDKFSPDQTNYSHTQTSSWLTVMGSYSNLFYIYPTPKHKDGVKLSVQGFLDMDGVGYTDYDKHPLTLELKLNDHIADAAVRRNEYYRVQINVAGLTGADIQATVVPLEWEGAVSDKIVVGQ